MPRNASNRSKTRTHGRRYSSNRPSKHTRGRPRRARTTRAYRRHRLPPRDARGRFVRMERLVEFEEEPISARPIRERAIVKRRWWRVDGPQDPNLPKGYAYAR